jgi:hypothetical protein
VEVDVEVQASRRLDSGGQQEFISLCRIAVIVICNNILFLSNLLECKRPITITGVNVYVI